MKRFFRGAVLTAPLLAVLCAIAFSSDLKAQTTDWPPALPVFSERPNLDKAREFYRDPKIFTAAPGRVDLDGIVVFDPLPNDGEKERLFFTKLFDTLQESAEGRRILQGLVEEYQLSGMKLRVQLAPFPGSTVEVDKDGVEGVGGRARAYSYPSSGLYKLNRIFMEFKDQDAALRDAASNAGHELTHIRNYAEVKRRTHGAFTSIWSGDVRDELEARVEGWIVATELGTKGRPNIYSEEIRAYLENPARYLKEFGTEPSYADSFDGAGMEDPLADLQSRIDGVKAQAAGFGDDLPALKLMAWAVQHFKTVHGIIGLDSVGDQIDDEIDAYNGLTALQDARGRLSAAGAAPLAALKRAAADPDYNVVPSRLTEIRGRLASALQQNPPPPAPPAPAGQITMTELREMISLDQQRYPEHWLKAPGAAPAQ